MSAETLARWQFGITTVYHFFFVPITIALSLLVAVMQTIWYRSGEEKMLRLTKFFGKLFLINFAMGVVTGIVQEFQFGMNWSEYSRFVGDIFGAPLAMEALIAFFLESVFLGMWIFGWDRLPKKLHLTSIWLAAIGTMISAIFILAANSWMQNPTGATYNTATGRAETSGLGGILDVISNPVALVTLPHVLSAAYMTAGGLILGISGWHLVKNAKGDSDKAAADGDAWRWATRFGAWVLIVAGLGTFITGDLQGKVMTSVQPMKMAAAEALWTTEQPASFSLFTIGSLDGSKEVFSIKVPYILSFLATGSFDGKVLGIDDLVAEAKNGTIVGATTALQNAPEVKANVKAASSLDGFPGFVPNLPVTYWTFRFMMGLGFLAFLLGAWVLFATRKGATPKGGKLWTAAMIAAPLAPLFGNSFGWIFTEMGRQPFIVFGVLPTMSANSPGVTAPEVAVTMVLYTAIYGVLAVVEVGLLLHFIKLGLPEVSEPSVLTDDDAPLSFAY